MKILKLTKNIKGEERNITRKIYILFNRKHLWLKLKIDNN